MSPKFILGSQGIPYESEQSFILSNQAPQLNEFKVKLYSLCLVA